MATGIQNDSLLRGKDGDTDGHRLLGDIEGVERKGESLDKLSAVASTFVELVDVLEGRYQEAEGAEGNLGSLKPEPIKLFIHGEEAESSYYPTHFDQMNAYGYMVFRGIARQELSDSQGSLGYIQWKFIIHDQHVGTTYVSYAKSNQDSAESYLTIMFVPAQDENTWNVQLAEVRCGDTSKVYWNSGELSQACLDQSIDAIKIANGDFAQITE